MQTVHMMLYGESDELLLNYSDHAGTSFLVSYPYILNRRERSGSLALKIPHMTILSPVKSFGVYKMVNLLPGQGGGFK
jgi:hypothetical protein